MADVTDSILGIIPVAVAGGVAIGMTNMAMGMANSSQRRQGSTSQRGRGRKVMRKRNVGAKKAQRKARALVTESNTRSAAGKKSINHILFG